MVALVQQLQEKVSHLCASSEKYEKYLLSKLNGRMHGTRAYIEKNPENDDEIKEELNLKFKECTQRLNNIETILNYSLEVDSKYISNASSIVSNFEFKKILSYFPEAKRNLKILNIFNGTRDGWNKENFVEKVFNKGPTLIILKTT